MDTVILLFRLVVKIATMDGVTRQPHPRLDPVQGGSVSIRCLSICTGSKSLLQTGGYVGHHPHSSNSFQHPVLILEVLLGGILAVYASIALSYTLRYYKNHVAP